MTAPNGLLQDARVYLSGPMDFVASRADEKKTGWRVRISQVLASYGVTVFDPWNKPEVYGLEHYGEEGEQTTSARNEWTYTGGKDGARARSKVSQGFWPALHIDLRMVDTSDFLVCYCPTNIYSVGTPHEIILARQQRKPVLFVSPYVKFPSLGRLEKHLTAKGDQEALGMLKDLTSEVPIKENLNASPSLWYMPLIGVEHFFDGFGFALPENKRLRDQFMWREETSLDKHETANPPQRPLLSFLASLNSKLPDKWDRRKDDFAQNDDWLLWKLQPEENGAFVHAPKVDEPAAT